MKNQTFKVKKMDVTKFIFFKIIYSISTSEQIRRV